MGSFYSNARDTLGLRYDKILSYRAAKGGSLVKIQNVSPGVDLLTAILNRYADNVDENVLVVSSKAVELVGMQSTSVKQRCSYSCCVFSTS